MKKIFLAIPNDNKEFIATNENEEKKLDLFFEILNSKIYLAPFNSDEEIAHFSLTTQTELRLANELFEKIS